MSTWHKKITQSLADSVSAVLSDMKEDNKDSQNKMMKKGKGESSGQIKPKQDLPEEDEEENGNEKKAKNGNDKVIKGKFASRADSDKNGEDSGKNGEDSGSINKKRKAISKAIRNTSSKSKKVKLTNKKEKISIAPTIAAEYDPSVDAGQYIQERAHLREVLEASFDTVFQYANKEEEAFREQWMNEFKAYIQEIDPQAYVDPLQGKVLYIEGLTSRSAANRYLASCVANASMAGGQYANPGSRGGDPRMSARQQGREVGNVVRPMHQTKN